MEAVPVILEILYLIAAMGPKDWPELVTRVTPLPPLPPIDPVKLIPSKLISIPTLIDPVHVNCKASWAQIGVVKDTTVPLLTVVTPVVV